MQMRKMKRFIVQTLLAGFVGVAAGSLGACSREAPSAVEAGGAAASEERRWSEEDLARAARLVADVEHVQSLRDVKRLQHAFAHYAESGEWKAMAGLFAEDGRYVEPGVEI